MLVAMNYESELREKNAELRKLRTELDFLRATNAQHLLDILRFQEEIQNLKNANSNGQQQDVINVSVLSASGNTTTDATGAEGGRDSS